MFSRRRKKINSLLKMQYIPQWGHILAFHIRHFVSTRIAVSIQSRSHATRAALITIRCCTVNKVKLWPYTVSVNYTVEHVASFKHTGLQTDRDFVISRVITGGAGRMYIIHRAAGMAFKQSFRRTSCIVTRHSARHFAAA